MKAPGSRGFQLRTYITRPLGHGPTLTDVQADAPSRPTEDAARNPRRLNFMIRMTTGALFDNRDAAAWIPVVNVFILHLAVLPCL